MPATWNGILSTSRSEGAGSSLPGLAWPVELRRHPRARVMRLRLDEARQRCSLTCPARMSRRAALDWAVEQRDWVEAQLAANRPAEPFVPARLFPSKGARSG